MLFIALNKKICNESFIMLAFEAYQAVSRVEYLRKISEKFHRHFFYFNIIFFIGIKFWRHF